MHIDFFALSIYYLKKLYSPFLLSLGNKTKEMACHNDLWAQHAAEKQKSFDGSSCNAKKSIN